jgi:hypothetical protein
VKFKLSRVPLLNAMAQRLRAASKRTLVAALTVGLVGTSAILLLWPHGWLPGMLLVVVTSAALWGLVDQALTELRARPVPAESVEIVYVGLRYIAGTLGILAALEFLLSALHMLLGGGWN